MAERVVDKLEEALMEKYDRLVERLEDPSLSKGEYDYDRTEKELSDLIKEMQTFYKTDCEYWAKQEERRIEEEHNKEMLALEEKKLAEHNRVEQERNETNIQLEKEKQKLTWQRVAFEFGKVILSAGISAVVFFKAQEKVLKFEETGRITSTAGRELHLPKLPSWK